jgi:NAD(P)-dependent dehydrogenase (short-subunit alcohol dehydrogenase family)
MTSFAGRVVIVVGAASRGNMGQCIARRFAQQGARVVVAGRHADCLEELAKELDGAFALCDFTVQDDIDALVQLACKRYGRVDVGINCTGWGLVCPFEQTTEDQLQRMMDLQFKGPFQFMQALVKVMTPGSSIIMISSAVSVIMAEQHSAYMGTKAGIDHVVRTVANEYGAKGIRANTISPGVTDTPMAADLLAVPQIRRVFESCYPLGRVGTVDDIASAALWLAGDDCFMTGQNLQVNGGLTLRRNPTFAEMGPAFESASQHLRSDRS